MDGDLQIMALRFGVLLLGIGLALHAIHGLITGRTTGYYRSHRYEREGTPTRYFAWIALRAVIAALCLYVWHRSGAS